jgi:cytochrome bd-type quinol oxidase subunit 1
LLIAIGLSLSWPWTIGTKLSPNAKVEAKLEFLTRGAYLVVTVVFFFIVAAIGSILILREARNEYSEQKDENLRDLIEGTQRAIQEKKNES